MFLIAAAAAALIVLHGHYVPASPADSIVVSTMIYAAFWLIMFERLGLYRRSFALSMKDEIYAPSAALALGALPQFVLFTFVPSVSSSRSVLLLSVAIASVTVGVTRVTLHAMRERLAAAYQRSAQRDVACRPAPGMPSFRRWFSPPIRALRRTPSRTAGYHRMVASANEAHPDRGRRRGKVEQRFFFTSKTGPFSWTSR
jgi:hypothetical protein